MKGYIDMVFENEGRYYLIDYKSHMLGNYHHSALNKIIARENYNYEQHFGGVYYLLLRGMTPETGAEFGVYRDMPNLGLVDRLSVYLGGD